MGTSFTSFDQLNQFIGQKPASDAAQGMLTPGNIDLYNRPHVKNPDGTTSTVRSISANIDGHEVLIPTVSDDGRVVSNEEAIQIYKKTGKHLGIFDSPANATTYAAKLHDDYAAGKYDQQQGIQSFDQLNALIHPVAPTTPAMTPPPTQMPSTGPLVGRGIPAPEQPQPITPPPMDRAAQLEERMTTDKLKKEGEEKFVLNQLRHTAAQEQQIVAKQLDAYKEKIQRQQEINLKNIPYRSGYNPNRYKTNEVGLTPQEAADAAHLSQASRYLDQMMSMDPDKTGLIASVQREFGTSNAIAEKIPFLRGAFQGGDMLDLYRVAKKYDSGQKLLPTEESLMRAFSLFTAAQQHFHPGILDEAASVAASTPSFSVEFAATEGIYNAGRQVGVGAVEAAVKNTLARAVAKSIGESTVGRLAARAIESGAGKYVGREAEETAGQFIKRGAENLAGWTTGGLTQSAIQPTYPSDILDRMTPKYIQEVDATTGKLALKLDQQGEDFGTAVVKAFGQSAVNVMSERSGLLIEHPMEVLEHRLLGKWLQKQGTSVLTQKLERAAEHLGWNGILGEVFEEEIARPFSNAIDNKPLLDGYSWDNLATEFIGFSMWGAAGHAVGYGTTKAGQAMEARTIKSQVQVLNGIAKSEYGRDFDRLDEKGKADVLYMASIHVAQTPQERQLFFNAAQSLGMQPPSEAQSQKTFQQSKDILVQQESERPAAEAQLQGELSEKRAANVASQKAEDTLASAPEKTARENTFAPPPIVGEPTTPAERELQTQKEKESEARKRLDDEQALQQEQKLKVVDRRRVKLEDLLARPETEPENPDFRQQERTRLEIERDIQGQRQMLDGIARERMYVDAADMQRSLGEQKIRGKALTNFQQHFLNGYAQLEADQRAYKQQYEPTELTPPPAQPVTEAAPPTQAVAEAPVAAQPVSTEPGNQAELAAPPKATAPAEAEAVPATKGEQPQSITPPPVDLGDQYAQAVASGDTQRATELVAEMYRQTKGTSKAQQPVKLQAPPTEKAKFGAGNKVFTEERMQKALAELKNFKPGSGTNVVIPGGIPVPEGTGRAIRALIDVGGYYFEGGVREFAKWSQAVVGITGEWAKPHLKTVYDGIRLALGEHGVETKPTAESVKATKQTPAQETKQPVSKTEQAPKLAGPPVKPKSLGEEKPKAEFKDDEQRFDVATGKATNVSTPGHSYPAEFVLGELAELTQSTHPTSFAPNENFPMEVQPRDRTNEQSKKQVIDLSSPEKFDPAHLINTSTTPENGPPIATPGGIVLGGNGRVMIAKRVALDDRWGKYVAYLKEHLADFGFKEADLGGLTQPFIWRRLKELPKTVDEVAAMGRDLNESHTKAMDPLEEAIAAGKQVSQKTAEGLIESFRGMGDNANLKTLISSDPMFFIKRFTEDGIWNDANVSRFTDPSTGGLSESGKDFVLNTLRGAVIQDYQLLKSLSPETFNKMDLSLPYLLQLLGRKDEWAIVPMVRDALRQIVEVGSRPGVNIAAYQKQAHGLFGETKGIDNPAVNALALTIAELGPIKLKKAFADFVYDSRGENMFAKPEAWDSFNKSFGARLDADQYALSFDKVAGHVVDEEKLKLAPPPAQKSKKPEAKLAAPPTEKKAKLEPPPSKLEELAAQRQKQITERKGLTWEQQEKDAKNRVGAPPGAMGGAWKKGKVYLSSLGQDPIGLTAEGYYISGYRIPGKAWVAHAYDPGETDISRTRYFGIDQHVEASAYAQAAMGRPISEWPTEEESDKQWEAIQQSLPEKPSKTKSLEPPPGKEDRDSKAIRLAKEKHAKYMAEHPEMFTPEVEARIREQVEKAGWTLDSIDDGSFEVSHPDFNGNISFNRELLKKKDIDSLPKQLANALKEKAAPEAEMTEDLRRAHDDLEAQSKSETLAPPPGAEKKRDAIARAKQIKELHATIAEAPNEIDVREGQIQDLQYFLDRSAAGKMDANDWDGLMRTLDTSDLEVPESEQEAADGTKVTPTETKYLEGVQEEVRNELQTIKANVGEMKDELVKLKSVGPLPQDVADRHGLTVDGELKPKDESKLAPPPTEKLAAPPKTEKTKKSKKAEAIDEEEPAEDQGDEEPPEESEGEAEPTGDALREPTAEERELAAAHEKRDEERSLSEFYSHERDLAATATGKALQRVARQAGIKGDLPDSDAKVRELIARAIDNRAIRQAANYERRQRNIENIRATQGKGSGLQKALAEQWPPSSEIGAIERHLHPIIPSYAMENAGKAGKAEYQAMVEKWHVELAKDVARYDGMRENGVAGFSDYDISYDSGYGEESEIDAQRLGIGMKSLASHIARDKALINLGLERMGQKAEFPEEGKNLIGTGAEEFEKLKPEYQQVLREELKAQFDEAIQVLSARGEKYIELPVRTIEQLQDGQSNAISDHKKPRIQQLFKINGKEYAVTGSGGGEFNLTQFVPVDEVKGEVKKVPYGYIGDKASYKGKQYVGVASLTAVLKGEVPTTGEARQKALEGLASTIDFYGYLFPHAIPQRTGIYSPAKTAEFLRWAQENGKLDESLVADPEEFVRRGYDFSPRLNPERAKLQEQNAAAARAKFEEQENAGEAPAENPEPPEPPPAKAMAPKAAEKLTAAVMGQQLDLIPGMTPEQRDAIIGLWSVVAKYKGQTLDQFVGENLAAIQQGGKPGKGALFQAVPDDLADEVRKGGGEPIGMVDYSRYGGENLVYFNDLAKQTLSTMALPLNEVTAEAVDRHIRETRKNSQPADIVKGKAATLFQMDTAPTFFHKSEKVVEAGPAAASGEQWMATLRNRGVKDEEIQWTGLDDFLKDKKKVTKQELAEFIRANEVNVKEVLHQTGAGEKSPLPAITQINIDWPPEGRYEVKKLTPFSFHGRKAITAHVYHGHTEEVPGEEFTIVHYPEANIWEGWRGDHGEILVSDGDHNYYSVQEAIEDDFLETEQHAAADVPAGAPKYGKFTLPGGEDYRELLLTMPTEAPPIGVSEQDYADDPDNKRIAAAKTAFYGGHFDEPNVLAHVRFTDRTDADGKRVLFLEEIQSDWHQKGRKYGYQQPLDSSRWTAEKIGQRLFTVRDENGRTLGSRWADDEAGAISEQLEMEQRSSDRVTVPDAPFKKTWHELALKRMLRYAADNGYDKLAWTPGEVQNERYDLSQHVDMVRYYPHDGALVVFPKGETTGRTLAEGLRPEELDDYIGKDVAQRLRDTEATATSVQATTGGKPAKTLSGLDLKVGGTGMLGFYDRIIPRFLADYGKKWGAKVGETTLSEKNANRFKVEEKGGDWIIRDTEDGHIADEGFDSKAEAEALARSMTSLGDDYREDARRVHSMDITPAMRESVMSEGQALFQRGKGAVSFLEDGRAVINAFHADASTFLHESFHVFRRILNPADLKVVEKWAGVENGNWTVPAEEKWARGAEVYFFEGRAPNAEVKSMFQKFAGWLKDIYKKLSRIPGAIKLSDEVRDVYSRLLGGKEELPAETPEAPQSKLVTTEPARGPPGRIVLTDADENTLQPPPGTRQQAPAAQAKESLTPPPAVTDERMAAFEQRMRERAAREEAPAKASLLTPPPSERKAAVAEERGFGSKNVLFTNERMQEAERRLNQKLGRLHTGLDASMLKDAAEVVGYYLEGGLHSLADIGQKMIARFGEGIHPYLAEAYNLAKQNAVTQAERVLDSARLNETERATVAKFWNAMRKLPDAVQPPPLEKKVKPQEKKIFIPKGFGENEPKETKRAPTPSNPERKAANAPTQPVERRPVEPRAEPAVRPESRQDHAAPGPGPDRGEGRTAGSAGATEVPPQAPPGGAKPVVKSLKAVPAAKLDAPANPRGRPVYDGDAWVERLHRYNLPENAPVPTVRLSQEMRDLLIFPGQPEVVEMALSGLDESNAFVIATSPGTGKTYMSSAILAERKPAHSLILTTSRDLMQAHIDTAAQFGVEIKELPKGEFKPPTDGNYITTYTTAAMREGLDHHNWPLVIADESTQGRRWYADSKSGIMLKNLGQSAQKILYMSATPFHSAIEVGYMDKLGLWKDMGFKTWAEQFGIRLDPETGTWSAPFAPRKLAKLREQLIERGQFVNMDRAMEGYKASFGVVPLSQSERQGVQNIIKGFAIVEQYFKAKKLEGMIRAVRGNRTTYIKNYIERSRLPQAIEIGKKLDAKGWKVIYFSEHRSEVPELYEFMRKADEATGGEVSRLIPPLPSVTGALRKAFGDDLADYSGAHSAARTNEKNEFNNGNKKHIFATYGAGGVGVSLHDLVGDAPRAAVYLGLPWSGIMFDQAVGRPWRFGTKSNVHGIFLMSNSKNEVELVLGKVAQRFESLRAVVSGVDKKDPLVDAMQSIDGALDYEFGNEQKTNGEDYLDTVDTKAISGYQDLPIGDAADAMNKGMQLPEKMPPAPPPKILYQDEAPQSEPRERLTPPPSSNAPEIESSNNDPRLEADIRQSLGMPPSDKPKSAEDVLAEKQIPPPGSSQVRPEDLGLPKLALWMQEKGAPDLLTHMTETAETAIRTFMAYLHTAPYVMAQYPETAKLGEMITRTEMQKRREISSVQYDLENDILKDIGHGSVEAKQVYEALRRAQDPIEDLAGEVSEETGTAFPENVLRAAQRIRDEIYEPLWERAKEVRPNLGYLNHYATIIKAIEGTEWSHPAINERWMPQDLAKDFSLEVRQAMARDPYSPYLRKRRKAINWNLDIHEVMNAYVPSVLKVIHDTRPIWKGLALVSQIPQTGEGRLPLLRQYAERYLRTYAGVPGEYKETKQATYRLARHVVDMHYNALLQMNPKWALVNLSQSLQNTWPDVGANYVRRGVTSLFSDAGRELVARAGILSDMPLPEGKLRRVGKQVLHATTETTEFINRAVSYLASLEKAKDLGMFGPADQVGDLTFKRLNELAAEGVDVQKGLNYAYDAVAREQFMYTNAYIQFWLRDHPILGMFKSFPVREAELVTNMLRNYQENKPAARRMLTLLATEVVGGLFGGVPLLRALWPFDLWTLLSPTLRFGEDTLDMIRFMLRDDRDGDQKIHRFETWLKNTGIVFVPGGGYAIREATKKDESQSKDNGLRLAPPPSRKKGSSNGLKLAPPPG